MGGPEHFLEAERLAATYKDAITTAEAMPSESPRDAEERYIACANARALLEKAQVHAILASAAATVIVGVPASGVPEFRRDEVVHQVEAWAAVLA